MATRPPRYAVAYEVLEEPHMKHFRHAWDQVPLEQILKEPRRGLGVGIYFCGACYEEEKPTRPKAKLIYDSTSIPEDAECVVCHFSIRELQQFIQDLHLEGES